MTLNRKMLKLTATSSSSALIISEAAAIAGPRKSLDPKTYRIFMDRDNLKISTSSAVRNAIEMVTIDTGNDDTLFGSLRKRHVNLDAIME